MSDNTQKRQDVPLSSSIHNEQTSMGSGNVQDTAAGTNSATSRGEVPPPQVQDEITDRTTYQQVAGSNAADEAATGADSGSTVVEGIDQWVNGDTSYGKQFLPDSNTGIGNVGELPEEGR